MIPVTTYKDRSVAVFGLGRSGIVAARALVEGGANVTVWDDNADSRKKAAEAGLQIVDYRELDWARQAALVVAPGVPLTHPEPHPVVRRAMAAQCPIIGDIELFGLMRPSLPINTVIAITGTNGKSTTTALVTHVINACGGQAVACGNIGNPILDLEPLAPDGVYVIELSSYQIDLTDSLRPEVAVLLNVTADHLDRHGNMENYVAVKRRIFSWQRPTDVAIIGVDDEYGFGTVSQIGGGCRSVIPITVGAHSERGVFVEDGQLWDTEANSSGPVCSLDDVATLPGAHNWQNAAAAYAATRALGYSPEDIAAALRTFPGLAHRLEYVARVGGVDYYNDSKATNADASARALDCFNGVHWILGGQAKDGGIDSLKPWFNRVGCAYVIGEAAEPFAAVLEEAGVTVERCGTLDRAVMAAAGAASIGDVVLLSPACASFDQYPDFEVRGDHFKSLVVSLKQEACA